jgi:riboflavin kinase / FMN adenylyltransferase
VRVVHGSDDTARAAVRTDGAVVTIGAYDGVHLGHQAVLRLVRELAAARALDAALVTFDRHPAEVVRPDSAPRLLTTLEQRVELLEGTGDLDLCWVLTFDEARSRESAEDFVREVLVDGIGARLVVVGADFHFGHKRGGNVPLLERMGAELGFEVLGLGLVAIEADTTGTPYSSTRVRELLGKGDVAEATRLLGRPHEVRGVVERGDRRGGPHLGVPTANLSVPQRICLPADGVYAGTFSADDATERPAAISVGTRPTFYEHGDVLLEAHVLDFGGDLYNQRAKVRFREWIRGQERFETTDALVKQMEADVEETRRILGI